MKRFLTVSGLPVVSGLAPRWAAKRPNPQKSDTQRRQREEAKQLAAEHGIEIEKLREGGMNVWPPKGLADCLDPFDGDHFADGLHAAWSGKKLALDIPLSSKEIMDVSNPRKIASILMLLLSASSS